MPTQRKLALHNKIYVLEKMTNAIAKANKMRDDIPDKIDKWTYDSYATETPLQLRKDELLGLIDNLIGRLIA